MRTFTPSRERENEVLWGHKDGYEEWVRRNKPQPNNGNK